MRFVEERQRYVVHSMLVDRVEMIAGSVPHTRVVILIFRGAATRTATATALQTTRHTLGELSRCLEEVFRMKLPPACHVLLLRTCITNTLQHPK